MDEYARYIWERRPDFKNSDPGDVSDQVDRTRQNNRMKANFVGDMGPRVFFKQDAIQMFSHDDRNISFLGVSALSFTMQVFQVVYERSGLGPK